MSTETVQPTAETKVICHRCLSAPSTGSCCSSHGHQLCHACYRRTHFVEVCGCSACDAEGLPKIYPPKPEPVVATWPPPWTLKPTHGDPHDAESLEICEGVGWDLSFGFRLNVGHDDAEDVNSPLTIGAHFSDADLARGFVQREVSPGQLEEFARLLLNLAAKHKKRAVAALVRGSSTDTEGK